MTEFVVVDLLSQATAVENYVRGWSPVDIVEWLQRFGEVHAVGERAYIFIAHTGRQAAFWFTAADELTIASRYH